MRTSFTQRNWFRCLVFFIFLVTLFISCKPTPIETKSEIKILFLGNSITHHGPHPLIKWYGDWGMAASSRDKDYVHVLMDMLHEARPAIKFEYKERNIADWEQDFNYDLSQRTDMKELMNGSYRPDILIIRLGENVQWNYAVKNDYGTALSKLINKFKVPQSDVLITGNFWPLPFKDSVQRKVAKDNNYTYVDFSKLETDSNKAIDQYEGGVGQHPGDIGMKKIAKRLMNGIMRESILTRKILLVTLAVSLMIVCFFLFRKDRIKQVR